MNFNVNLNQLHVFYAISKCNSFKEASFYLNLTTPAVSIQIKNLEKALGFKLFTRTNTKLKLTEKGKFLLPFAEKIFEQIDTFNIQASRIVEENSNCVTIAISMAPAEVLSPLLYQYIKKHLPEIELIFVTPSYQKCLYKLRSKEADLVIKSADFPQDISMQKFIDFEIPLVASPNNPIIKEQDLSLNKMRELKFIVPPLESGFSRHIYSFFNEHNIPLPAQSSRIDSTIASKFIQNSNFCAFLNALLIEDDLRSGKLIKLSSEVQPEGLFFSIGYLKESLQNKKVKKLLNLLQDIESFNAFKDSISTMST